MNKILFNLKRNFGKKIRNPSDGVLSKYCYRLQRNCN